MTVMRVGAKVRTRDANAVRHSRRPEKPETLGIVVDHFRTVENTRTPPYLVKFPDGESAWYDEDEVSKPTKHRRGT